MSLANIYKTLCDGLGLSPVNGSYVQALGNHFGVVDAPGKRYEDEVLVAALVNYSSSGNGIQSPDGNSSVEASNGSIDIISDGELLAEIDGIASLLSDTYIQLMSFDGNNYVRVTSNNHSVEINSYTGGTIMTSSGDISLSSAGQGSLSITNISSEISSVNDIYLTPGLNKYIYPQQLQTFASDAAAGSGGVPQGAMYLRSTGELAVKL